MQDPKNLILYEMDNPEHEEKLNIMRTENEEDTLKEKAHLEDKNKGFCSGCLIY